LFSLEKFLAAIIRALFGAE
jgi:hypothetical protein